MTSLVSQGGGAGIAKLKYTIHDTKSNVIYLADEADDQEPEFPTRVHFGSGGKLIEADTIQFKSGDRFLEDIGSMTEGINAIDQSKIDADTALEVGELYLIGGAVYRCTDRKNLGKVQQGTPRPAKLALFNTFLPANLNLTIGLFQPNTSTRLTPSKYITKLIFLFRKLQSALLERPVL